MSDTMQLPRDKTALLAALAASWQDYCRVLDGVDEGQWEGAADARGWTVKDHAAHVTAWENVMVEVFRTRTPPYQTLQIPEEEWVARGYASAWDTIYAQTSGQSLRRIRRNRDITHARLVAILGELTDDDLRRPFEEYAGFGGEITVMTAVARLCTVHLDNHRIWITAILENGTPSADTDHPHQHD